MAHIIRIGKNIPHVMVTEHGESSMWVMCDYQYGETGVINVENSECVRSYRIRECVDHDTYRVTLLHVKYAQGDTAYHRWPDSAE